MTGHQLVAGCMQPNIDRPRSTRLTAPRTARWDREFESGLLQRRVRSEPGLRRSRRLGEAVRGAAQPARSRGAAPPGADGIRGRSLDRSDLARAVGSDGRPGAAAAGAAGDHLSS
jgi:hypothetical protein